MKYRIELPSGKCNLNAETRREAILKAYELYKMVMNRELAKDDMGLLNTRNVIRPFVKYDRVSRMDLEKPLPLDRRRRR